MVICVPRSIRMVWDPSGPWLWTVPTSALRTKLLFAATAPVSALAFALCKKRSFWLVTETHGFWQTQYASPINCPDLTVQGQRCLLRKCFSPMCSSEVKPYPRTLTRPGDAIDIEKTFGAANCDLNTC